MKKILLLLTLVITCFVKAQTVKPLDSLTAQKKFTAVQSNVDSVKNSLKGVDRKVSALKPAAPIIEPGKCMAICISLAPFILYFLLLFIVFKSFKNNSYSIGDALKDDAEPASVITETKSGETTPTTTTIYQAKGQNSASRLIAFLTGITTLTLVTCLTSYWIYKGFTSNDPVDFSKLTTLFVALGVGVIPYGFNKAASAFNG